MDFNFSDWANLLGVWVKIFVTGDGMSLKSAAGEEFLKTLENWLGSQTEVLILIRYTRAAGNI